MGTKIFCDRCKREGVAVFPIIFDDGLHPWRIWEVCNPCLEELQTIIGEFVDMMNSECGGEEA